MKHACFRLNSHVKCAKNPLYRAKYKPLTFGLTENVRNVTYELRHIYVSIHKLSKCLYHTFI